MIWAQKYLADCWFVEYEAILVIRVRCQFKKLSTELFIGSENLIRRVIRKKVFKSRIRMMNRKKCPLDFYDKKKLKASLF